MRLTHCGVTIATLTDAFTIGREQGNRLTLSGESVSRHHCAIARQGIRWYIRDLGSANGTLVNGQRITAARFLKDGDTIQIGNVLLFVELLEIATMPLQRA